MKEVLFVIALAGIITIVMIGGFVVYDNYFGTYAVPIACSNCGPYELSYVYNGQPVPPDPLKCNNCKLLTGSRIKRGE